MINNKEIYHFDSEPDSTEPIPELTSPEDPETTIFPPN